MGLSDLPYLTERKAMAVPKGKTRLEATAEQRPLTKVDDKAFRKEVIARDGYRCRACGRKVIVTLARVPERLEIHHIHGRTGDLRFESRSALVTCGMCHQKLTGKINAHKLIVLATKTFTTRQGVFTDARFPVVFKELA